MLREDYYYQCHHLIITRHFPNWPVLVVLRIILMATAVWVWTSVINLNTFGSNSVSLTLNKTNRDWQCPSPLRYHTNTHTNSLTHPLSPSHKHTNYGQLNRLNARLPGWLQPRWSSLWVFNVTWLNLFKWSVNSFYFKLMRRVFVLSCDLLSAHTPTHTPTHTHTHIRNKRLIKSYKIV